MNAVLLIALALGSQADAPLFSRPNPDIEAGSKALADRDYDGAIDLYRRAKANNARERAIVEYNVGIAALEKAQDLQIMQAVKQAQAAAGATDDGATLDEAVDTTPDFDTATDALERAYKLSDDPRVRSQAALGVGNSYALRKKYKKAIDGYRRSLVQNPDNAAARNNLRTTLRQMRAEQAPPQSGDEGDESESQSGESQEGEEGESQKPGGESSEDGEKKDGDDAESGDEGQDGETGDPSEDKEDGDTESDSDDDKKSNGDASGNRSGGDRDDADTDGERNGEGSENADSDGDQKEKADDAKSKGGEDKDEDGERPDDADDSASGEKSDADKEDANEKKGGEKDGDKGADDTDEDKLKQGKNGADGEDDKEKADKSDAEKPGDKGAADSKKPKDTTGKNPPKDPGKDGKGGSTTKRQESVQKQRARAILDAMRRRERPLGPVMMQPQKTPRRKTKKDW